MSEVKRDVCHACVSLPREAHCPVCDPEIGCRKELDAQRLRADTAERERNEALNAPNNVFKKMCDLAIEQRNEANAKLAAAEQRSAEMIEFIRDAADSAQSAGMLKAFISQLDAALNPNPEAESHAS